MHRAHVLLREGLTLAALGTTGLGRELAEADSRLRRPVSTSRRVAVVGVQAGAGTSTTVVQLAAVLAARRSGGVLAVDAATGPGGLAALAGVAHPLSLREAAAQTVGHGTAARARDHIPTGPPGLHVLGSPGARPTAAGELDAALRPVGRAFDVVLTDLGARAQYPGLLDAVAGHHAVLLVARADRGTAEHALATTAALLRAGSPPVMIALVDVGGRAGPSTALVRRALSAVGLAVPVRSVPHDRALAGHPPTAPLPERGLAARTAVLGLAGDLVALATGGPR